MTAHRAIIRNRASRLFFVYTVALFVLLRVVLFYVYGQALPMRWEQSSFIMPAVMAIAIVVMTENRKSIGRKVRGFEVMCVPDAGDASECKRGVNFL